MLCFGAVFLFIYLFTFYLFVFALHKSMEKLVGSPVLSWAGDCGHGSHRDKTRNQKWLVIALTTLFFSSLIGNLQSLPFCVDLVPPAQVL